jgi:hypothetical protein
MERTPPLLHRDLMRYRSPDALNHPLLVARPYAETYNAIYNREYQSKRSELEQATSAGNWRKVIWLHERPFRATALREIASAMTDEQYWGLVSEVWLDSVVQKPDLWAKLWSSKRPRRDQVMLEDEHRLLAQLPTAVAIYFGYRGYRRTVDSLCWTLDPAVALDMAPDGPGRLYLASALVERRHIQALFANRGGTHLDPEVVVFSRDRCNVRAKSQ